MQAFFRLAVATAALVFVVSTGQLVSAAAHGGGPVISKPTAEQIIVSAAVRTCENEQPTCTKKKRCLPCGETTETKTKVLVDCPEGFSAMSMAPPLQIDNTSLNGHLVADDYASTSAAAAGCGPCGATGQSDIQPNNAIQTLSWTRIHRLRDATERASFGMGIFSAYDVSLRFFTVDGTPKVHVFDPAHIARYMMRRSGTAAQYTDTVVHNAHDHLQLFDSNDQPTTNMEEAVRADLVANTGQVYRFDIINTAAVGEPADYHGRLTAMLERNGYGIHVSYRNWTPAELQEAPDRQWQIDTVKDDQGRCLHVHYHADQVGGSWVVSRVDLPNNTSVQYVYANGQLAAVNHADGSQSSFTVADNASTNLTTITYDDPAARRANGRTFTAYYTNQVSLITDNDLDYPAVYSAASQLVRMIVNGNDEVAYLSVIKPQGFERLFYEGGGKLRWQSMWFERYLQKWSLDTSKTNWNAFKRTTTEAMYTDLWKPFKNVNDVNWVQRVVRLAPPKVRDFRGRTIEYTYNSDQYPLTKTYTDGTMEKWQYNAFNQITRYEDRLGRVTRYEYDNGQALTVGNLTRRRVGLRMDNGQEVEVPGEYAEFVHEYYPAGHQHQHLLKASIDARGNRTEFTYNDQHLLASITEAADEANGPQAVRYHSYDLVDNTGCGAGRLRSTTDAEGRIVRYDYDARDRLTTTTYFDGSQEHVVYGSGAEANLVTQLVDRNGNITEFGYDSVSRREETIRGRLVAEYDNQGNWTAVPALRPETATRDTCSHLAGTNLAVSCEQSGNRQDFIFDYRHRPVLRRSYPNTVKQLETVSTYVNNDHVMETDPYGRKTYFVYRNSDKALIRTIQGTVPEDGLGSQALAKNASRITPDTNAAYLITSYELDAERQQTAIIDPRGIRTEQIFDSRGRLTERKEAVGSGEEARTRYTYDLQSNTVEMYHPRYFDQADAEGYQQARTVMTYGGRNLLASRTLAKDSDDEATEFFTYYLDRLPRTHTDFRGKVWVTHHHACCGRVQAKVQPDGSGKILNTDFNGNVTHAVVVSGLPMTPSDGEPTRVISDGGAPAYDWHDPDADDTVNETTMRYDERNRVTHKTVWLAAQGRIEDASRPNLGTGLIPIAGEDGIPATAGLTTRYAYDDDLFDGLGLDAVLSPYMSLLSLGTDSVGSAVAVTNPEGETRITVRDGVGRTVLQIDGEGDARQQVYDATVATTTGAAGTLVVTTRIVDPDYGQPAPAALALTSSVRTDAVGRVIARIDELGYQTTFIRDANGNRLTLTDPNGTGVSCTYDHRNRRISCVDTEGDTRYTIYDAASNVVQSVDGIGSAALGTAPAAQSQLAPASLGVTTCTFDPRNRRISCRDRLGGLTTYSYDDNNNMVSVEDAEGGLTRYAYDDRNLLEREEYPTHQAGTDPGDPGNDARAYSYDAARRLLTRIDQAGVLTEFEYDLANRLRFRRYPDDKDDEFRYDGASRLLWAHSERYNNTCRRSYYDDAILKQEVLDIDGVAYVIDHTHYDRANRLLESVYPSLDTVRSTWTARSQLEERQWNGARIARFTYDNGRREETRTYGNGLVTTFGYRDDNRVESIRTPGLNPGDTDVMHFTYTYDANKRKTLEADHVLPGRHQHFHGYDAKDRLTNWKRTTTDPSDILASQDWTLTLVGDWDDTTRNGVLEDRLHNAGHEITSINGAAVSHDAKGNLTVNPVRGDGYGWDFDNRLTAVNNGTSATYRYDALGRRIQKTVGSTVTTYVCFGAQVWAEYENGILKRNYVEGSYVDDHLAMLDGTGTYYYHANHVFSISAISDQTATVLGRYAYDADGSRETVSLAATAPEIQQGFTGQRLDPESGLWYFRARYYDPEAGRFLNRDAKGYVDGQSLYEAYFTPGNVDPFGFEVTKEPKAGIVYWDMLQSMLGSDTDPRMQQTVDNIRNFKIALKAFESYKPGGGCKFHVSTYYIDGSDTAAQFARDASRFTKCAISIYFGHGTMAKEGTDVHPPSVDQWRRNFRRTTPQANDNSLIGAYCCYAAQYTGAIPTGSRWRVTGGSMSDTGTVSDHTILDRFMQGHHMLKADIDALCCVCKRVHLRVYFGEESSSDELGDPTGHGHGDWAPPIPPDFWSGYYGGGFPHFFGHGMATGTETGTATGSDTGGATGDTGPATDAGE